MLSYSATSPWPQNRAEITAAKIHREILCDQNHKQTTKPRNKIVTNITQKGRSAAKKALCCFFTQELCDQHHYKKRFAPYIHVIRITQKGAGWTAKRFSARFRTINQGPATSAATLTTNLGL
ncbi:TPA: hypothetical protein ACXP60_002901 [Klebsiella variicola subsp. variicola]|uniref:hypothetical protein n=1 Tax=Klebsiella variicola TaxID=244366 RepID=UPI00115DD8D9|nr:hypothetical protein [Klebsiella variicola]UYK33425.1 hypothetical protein OCM00_15205 [Klebsiella pneumoniae]HDU4296766.1 hypothetical protein [Klebsiella variicola]